MSKPKYLYIDDESINAVEAVRDGFNDTSLIEVTIEEPQGFKEQKKDFLKRLNDYDGLILDFRLDQNMQLDVSYNAPAIAQELRTLFLDKENDLKACPIILCSTDERMRATYDADKTSHDLFDYKFLKGADPNWSKFAIKLKSLAKGYRYLNEGNTSVDKILGREDISKIDIRITERFIIEDSILSTYDIAHFVIKELFHHPGILIKERLVASRLGIDIEKSGEGWNELKSNILEKFKFTGLFSDGWERWWSDKIIDFFKDISGKRLSILDASERVAILKDKLNIQTLVAAKPIKYCTSTQFWTVCEGMKQPLDPLEGLRVYESVDLKPWQDPKFISFYAAEEERINREIGLRPHPSEKDRIQLIKDSLAE